jgi:hypothetical protein
MQETEENMRRHNLRFSKIRGMKKDGDSIFHYEVWGREKNLDSMLKALRENKRIRTFEY